MTPVAAYISTVRPPAALRARYTYRLNPENRAVRNVPTTVKPAPPSTREPIDGYDYVHQSEYSAPGRARPARIYPRPPGLGGRDISHDLPVFARSFSASRCASPLLLSTALIELPTDTERRVWQPAVRTHSFTTTITSTAFRRPTTLGYLISLSLTHDRRLGN